MPASTDSRTPSRLPWRSANAAMVSVSPNPALRVGERMEEGGRKERREGGKEGGRERGRAPPSIGYDTHKRMHEERRG